jgi:hypothetical protein
MCNPEVYHYKVILLRYGVIQHTCKPCTCPLHILAAGFAVLNEYRGNRPPSATTLYSWPPPLTMVIPMPPAPSSNVRGGQTGPSDSSISISKQDVGSSSTLATQPNAASSSSGSGSSSAVFDFGLLLSPPDTSAAAWVGTRFVVITTNTSWPDVAHLLDAVKMQGGNGTDSTTTAGLPVS